MYLIYFYFSPYLTVVECNGCQAEEQPRGSQTSADQEVPHPEVLPEQSTSDFDFNEFFNLEKTMPGLASVSAGAWRAPTPHMLPSHSHTECDALPVQARAPLGFGLCCLSRCTWQRLVSPIWQRMRWIGHRGLISHSSCCWVNYVRLFWILSFHLVSMQPCSCVAFLLNRSVQGLQTFSCLWGDWSLQYLHHTTFFFSLFLFIFIFYLREFQLLKCKSLTWPVCSL